MLMSGYDDDVMATDKASKKLAKELETAQPGTYNYLKVNVSHLVNKCTFGKVGTAKPCSGVKK